MFACGHGQTVPASPPPPEYDPTMDIGATKKIMQRSFHRQGVLLGTVHPSNLCSNAGPIPEWHPQTHRLAKVPSTHPQSTTPSTRALSGPQPQVGGVKGGASWPAYSFNSFPHFRRCSPPSTLLPPIIPWVTRSVRRPFLPLPALLFPLALSTGMWIFPLAGEAQNGRCDGPDLRV